MKFGLLQAGIVLFTIIGCRNGPSKREDEHYVRVETYGGNIRDSIAEHKRRTGVWPNPKVLSQLEARTPFTKDLVLVGKDANKADYSVTIDGERIVGTAYHSP